MSECEFGSAKKLVMDLLNWVDSEPYRGFLEDYVSDNTGSRLSSLITDNWDLLLGNPLRSSDVARAIAQFTLELPADDPFREGFLKELSDVDLGTVYYCDKNSAFLNRKDYRFLLSHDSPVSTMLSMGAGKLVSGDHDGGIYAWDSAYPPVFRKLEGHSSLITDIRVVDEDRFLSASSNGEIRVWDYMSGRMVNEFSVDEEIVNIEIFCGNMVVVNVIRESETELYLGIHQLLKQKRIALKSYDLKHDTWSWEKEFEVNGFSRIMPLPDNRAFLTREESTGFPTCLNCKSALIIDPETGNVDKLFQQLANECETVLYSSLEMPVVLKKGCKGFELYRHYGDGIGLSDHVQELFSRDIIPFLLPGLNLLFIGDEKQVFAKFPDYSRDNCLIFSLPDDQFIYRGRYYGACRQFGNDPEARIFRLYDLSTGDLVYSQGLLPGEFNLSVSMPDDETVVLSVPKGHLVFKDLSTGNDFTLRDFGFVSYEAMSNSQCFDPGRIVLRVPSGELVLIDTRSTPEKVLEADFIEKVLGARDELLFIEDNRENVIAYDTGTCCKLSTIGPFRDGIHAMLHLKGDYYGAWSPLSGFRCWDVRSGIEKFRYKMNGYELTSVLILEDGNLLCCGSKDTESFDWDDALVVLFEPETGKETELLRIRSNRDPFNGNIPFVMHNAIVGQCLELSDGKLLIPPHWSIVYRERTVFDIIIIDRKDTGELIRIRLDGYTPAWIEELPGRLLMICTGYWAVSEEKRQSRVFFRNMDTGELLFSSPELKGHARDVVYLSAGSIGIVQGTDLVSLFQINDGIRYIGDKPIEEMLMEDIELIDKNRKNNEIGRIGRFLRMPGHSSSTDYRWAELWGAMKGNSITEVGSGGIAVGNPSQFTLALVRSDIEKAFLFDNSVVLLGHNKKIGFLKEWCRAEESGS